MCPPVGAATTPSRSPSSHRVHPVRRLVQPLSDNVLCAEATIIRREWEGSSSIGVECTSSWHIDPGTGHAVSQGQRSQGRRRLGGRRQHPSCQDLHVRVTVDFVWREVGPIVVEAGRLRFPEVPESPGVYRLDLGQTVYIGEADRLRRRFQHYRTPGVKQPTNIRLNARMLGLLAEGGSLALCTLTTASIEVDGHRAPLDLRHRAARLLVENAALTAARIDGAQVENL